MGILRWYCRSWKTSHDPRQSTPHRAGEGDAAVIEFDFLMETSSPRKACDAFVDSFDGAKPLSFKTRQMLRDTFFAGVVWALNNERKNISKNMVVAGRALKFYFDGQIKQ